MKNMNREILENRIHERIIAMHDSQDWIYWQHK